MTADHAPGLSAEERGEQVAPWLVLFSQHLPWGYETQDGGLGVECSCGSSLYVGHLVSLIADREAARTAALRADLDAALARLGEVRTLADDYHEDAQAEVMATPASLARRAVYLRVSGDLRAALHPDPSETT